MPADKINRYKKTMKLHFCDESMELKYKKFQSRRGRSTANYSLSVLAFINLTFAFLEDWILGINSAAPLIAYLSLTVVCLLIVLFGTVSSSTSFLKLRILIPGLLTMMVLLWALYLQNYRLYHAIEITLLVIWMGSLNVLSFRLSYLLTLTAVFIFTSTVYLQGITNTKIFALIALMAAAYILTIYLSYILDRTRRMMFLTNETLKEAFSRQENWAYTLIDLDMSLSGILNFKDLIGRLMEHLKSVIDYDSYVLTSLDGKGPKPDADEIDGTLFEQEDNTLWSDELLTKLSQTRQASVSAQFETVKGFLGKEIKNFQHYRLDIPVFNESTLVGVVSLRRVSQAFDDLDMTASVSISTQAMMIFNRTVKASLLSAGLQQARAESVVKRNKAKAQDKQSSSPSTDIDLTADQSSITTTVKKPVGRDETVVPSAVVKKIKQDTETARKTITLLSRENAEHVSMDRYRTAAVEGEPLSLLLVEVDGLSSIREKEGDQSAYKIFAGVVKYVFSKTDKNSDVLGRYGQNGFSILLPKVDMNAAEKFAEGLREYTKNTNFKTPHGIRNATLSIGVAAITDETGNHESMVKRADMALFVAKKNGRNCVKVRL